MLPRERPAQPARHEVRGDARLHPLRRLPQRLPGLPQDRRRGVRARLLGADGSRARPAARRPRATRRRSRTRRRSAAPARRPARSRSRSTSCCSSCAATSSSSGVASRRERIGDRALVARVVVRRGLPAVDVRRPARPALRRLASGPGRPGRRGASSPGSPRTALPLELASDDARSPRSSSSPRT